MKKSIALFLVLALCVMCVACNNATPSEESADPNQSSPVSNQAPPYTASDVAPAAYIPEGVADKVRMILPADTSTLSPFEGENGGRGYILNTFYERLGIMDVRGEEMVLVLAKSVTQPKALTYDVEIYDYIYDTAGNHLTASDIVFCYNECLGLATVEALESVDKVEVTGDYTLRITLKKETMGVLLKVMQAVPIVSEAAYKASADKMATEPVGTTGYVCTKFISGSGLTCELKNVWQKPELISNTFARNVKTIEYMYIAETSQVRIALETGLADIAFSLAATDLEKFDTGSFSDQYDIHTDLDNRVLRLVYNGDESNICNDLALRQAIAYAIDRQSINNIVYAGKAEMPNALGSVLLSDYNPAWDSDGYYDYSVDDARAKLAESGYNGQTIRFITSANADYKTVAELIVTYLEAVGISCSLEVKEEQATESIIADPSAWDLYICPRGAEDYMVNDWMRWVPASLFNGTTQFHLADPKVQEYYDTMQDVNTYSKDVTNEASQYMEDQCYAYALTQAPVYIVYSNATISDVVVNYKAWPLANGCIFK